MVGDGKGNKNASLKGVSPTTLTSPFDAVQADAILELQLHRLTRLSIDEILKELGEVRGRIAEYEIILGSEKKLRGVIVKELEEIKKKYGDARRTEIQDEAAEISLEDLIADEQVAVTVSHSGYLKRTPISTYRQQRRGGTGRKGMSTREEDFVEQLFVASTHDYILVFTNKGRVYWLKVYEIPELSAAGKGKAIANLVSLQPGETVRALLTVRDLEEEGQYVFFATRNGTVKKTPLKDFSNVLSIGIIAIGIEKEDELVAASCTDGNQIVFLATHEGMAIRFEEDDVRPMGRAAYGVRGMNLEKGDYIVGMAVTPKERKKAKDGEAEVEPDPLRHRTGLRQAYRRGRVSPADARRQGRDQRQDHGPQRQGGLDHAGEREVGADGDQPVRQDHPHRQQEHPRVGPLGAGRAPAAVGEGRSPGGCVGHPAGRSRRERQRRERTAGAVAQARTSKRMPRPGEVTWAGLFV